MVGDSDSPLRARLLGMLAEKTWETASVEQRRDNDDEAVAMARRLGDPDVLCRVLQSSHDTNFGPDDLEHRLVITKEIQATARKIKDHSTLGGAHVRRMAALLEAGNLPAFDREHATLSALARQYDLRGNWRHAVVARATRASMRGAFDEAEQYAREALEAGQRAGDPDSLSIFGGQLFQIRWLQGRLAELEPLAPQFLRDASSFTPWRVAVALLYTDLDRQSAARSEFDQLAADGFAVLPRDRFWVVSIGVLAQVCAYLGDAARAGQLYEALAPFADRTGVTSFSQSCTGSNHRPLGVLSTVVGDLDHAVRHFESALTANRALGATPWLALTEVSYARALIQRAAAGDRDRARELAAGARAIAAELGMRRCLEGAEALLESLST